MTTNEKNIIYKTVYQATITCPDDFDDLLSYCYGKYVTGYLPKKLDCNNSYGYLKRIMQNACADYWQMKKPKDISFEELDLDNSLFFNDFQTNFSFVAIEDKITYAAFIDSIAPADLELIKGRADQLSYLEIGNRIGVSAEIVKKRLWQARERIKPKLKSYLKRQGLSETLQKIS